MQAAIGDRLHIRGNCVGHPDKCGEIVEVHGKAGEPPYLVRFDDGHTGLVFPGPDAVVEAKARGGGARKAAPRRQGRRPGQGRCEGRRRPQEERHASSAGPPGGLTPVCPVAATGSRCHSRSA